LIELYQHRLLRYLLFLTGKREVAEDLSGDLDAGAAARPGSTTGRRASTHGCSRLRAT